MATYRLNLQDAKSKRLLTETDQREIAAFFSAHPKADYEKHATRFAKKFNCSIMSVNHAVLRSVIGDFG